MPATPASLAYAAALKSGKRGRFPVAPIEARTVDGIVFDSAKEATRYVELKLLERAGKISSLRRQRKFTVDIDGRPLCDFTPDFDYYDEAGDWIVEDVKSTGTKKDAAYRLRKKAFELFYLIKVTEVVR